MDDASNVDDEEILTVFAESDATPLRPDEAAEDLPIAVEDLRDRFDELEERDLLRRNTERQSGTVYNLTDEGESRLDVPDDAVTEVEAQATGTGTGSTTRDQETPKSPPPAPGADSVDPPYEPPADVFESFDPPGTPDQKDQRRQALRAAYDYLRERGGATRAELVENVYPIAPGAYESPSDGWWSEVVQPGLTAVPGAVPDSGEDAWRFDEAAATGDGGE